MLSMQCTWRVIVTTAILLAAVNLPAQTDGDQLRASFERGETLRSQGKAGDAIPHLERALQLAPGVLGGDSLDTATIQLSLANAYRDMGRYPQAEPLYQRSLQIREARLGADHADIAQVVNSMANLYLYQGKYAQALPQYQRSLRIYEAKLGGGHLEVGRIASNLALVHEKLGQYAEAEPLFLRSLRIKESQAVRDEISIAATLSSLANLYMSTARYPDAELHYKRSLQIREAKLGANHIDVALTLNNLAILDVTLGRNSEAEPLYRRALQIRELRLGKDHPDVAATMLNLANLDTHFGRYAEAESLYQRVIQIQEAKLGRDHPDLAAALHGLGLVCMRLRQYSRADGFLRRSVQIREAKLGRDHPLVAAGLDALANLHRVMGQTAQAEPLLQRALQIRESRLGAGHPDVAASLSNLGLLHMMTNRLNEAEPLLQRSDRILESKFGTNHPEVARNLQYLGILYWAVGKNQEAEKTYQRTLQIREAQLTKDHPDVARTLHNLGLVYAAQERWDEAAEMADRSRRMIRQHVAHVLPALSEGEQLAFLKFDDASRLSAVLSLGIRKQDDPEIVLKSAGWLLNSKALTQQTMVERAYQTRDNKDPVTARISQLLTRIRTQLAAWFAAPQKPAQADDRQRQIDLLKSQEKDVAKQLAQASGRNVREQPWIEVDEVRKSVPNEAVLIDILRVDHQGFKGTDKSEGLHFIAWLIPASGQGNVEIVDLGPTGPIEDAVKAVRQGLLASEKTIQEKGEADAEKELRPVLEALTNLVLKPLDAKIRSKEQWIISPDGALWLFPWESLIWDDGYAVEKHKVRYVVSGRDVLPLPPTMTKTNSPMMMANPDFDLGIAQTQTETRRILTEAQMQSQLRSSSGSLRLGAVPRLPGTAIEAEAVRPNLERYAKAKPLVYTDKYALEGVFKVFARPRVAVLSTHGFFQDEQVVPNTSRATLNLDEQRPIVAVDGQSLENPLLRCGLLLAGVNRRAEVTNPNQDDGVLTGLEIVSADLRGTELVVLSACETGLGEVRHGEGISGLRQAFQLAGAQAVIATLWQVSDIETARLMNDFFANLADGQPKADALRNAQLKRMQSRRENFGAAHPFFWAPFTLTGS